MKGKKKSLIVTMMLSIMMVFTMMPMMGSVAYADDAAPDGSRNNPWVLEYGESMEMDTETYPEVNRWRLSGQTYYLEMTTGDQSVTVTNINNTATDQKSQQVVYGNGPSAPRFYINAKAQDADEVNLIFHKNYPVDDPIFDTVTVGNHQTVMIPSEGPEREGYTFVGWAMSSTGEAELYPGQDYQVEKLGTPEITFYAVWGQNSPNPNLTLDNVSLTAQSAQITYDGTPHELSGVEEGDADANGYLKVGTYTTTGNFSRTYDAYANISQVKVTATNGGIYHTPVGSAPIYYYRTGFNPGYVRVTGNYIPVTKGELKIDPIEISVKTESATKDADGTPLTADGQISYKVGDTDYAETFGHTDTIIKLIGEEYITIRTSGEQTAPGTDKNGYVYTLEGTSSGNYFVNEEKDDLGTLHVHGWSEPEYIWAEDNSSVTASRSCSACEEIQSEKAETTPTVIQQQSCENPEITMWTSARFNNPAFEVRTKSVETAGPAGHVWDEGEVTKEPTITETGIKTFTCGVCTATTTEVIPKLTPQVSGTLMAKMTAKGKKAMKIQWTKVHGAAGYDIFLAKCSVSDKKMASVRPKTINGDNTLTWTATGLKNKTAYKTYVKAYVMVGGKKTYVKTSPMMHAYSSGANNKYTNAKSVKVKKANVTLSQGKTFKIKASVKKLKKSKKLMSKKHAPELRYLTTDSGVATVTKGGKIAAKGKGTCTIYAYAHNGVSKQIKVTVK